MNPTTAAQTVDAIFDDDDLASAAIYSLNEVQTPCRVIVHRTAKDRALNGVEFAGLGVATRPANLLIRAAEVAEPQQGAVVSIATGAFLIGDAPVRHDVHGLVWRCGCDPLDDAI